MKSHKGIRILVIDDVKRILQRGCEEPDCYHDTHDELWISSKCHPNAGVRASLHSAESHENPLDTPILLLHCYACGEPICGVLVGETEHENQNKNETDRSESGNCDT